MALRAWGTTTVCRWGLLCPVLRGAPVWHRFCNRSLFNSNKKDLGLESLLGTQDTFPNDTTKAGTRPTFPDRTHQCASGIWGLLVCHLDGCTGSSRVLLYLSTHRHP